MQVTIDGELMKRVLKALDSQHMVEQVTPEMKTMLHDGDYLALVRAYNSSVTYSAITAGLFGESD